MNDGSPADVGGSTERVKELKRMGNRAMRCLNFDEAVKLYTEAILLCGSAGMGPDTRGGECLEVLYANRSSAYHSSGRYEEALADAENCILLENSSLGHQAKAAALDGLGRLREATQSKLMASLLLREDGAHEASGRCDSGSGISTSPSVFDAGGAGGGAECVGAVYAREKDENLRMRERLQLEIWTLNGRVGSKSLTPIPKEVLRQGRGVVHTLAAQNGDVSFMLSRPNSLLNNVALQRPLLWPRLKRNELTLPGLARLGRREDKGLTEEELPKS
jgi:hypothetical protein